MRHRSSSHRRDTTKFEHALHEVVRNANVLSTGKV